MLFCLDQADLSPISIKSKMDVVALKYLERGGNSTIPRYPTAASNSVEDENAKLGREKSPHRASILADTNNSALGRR